MDKTVRLWDMSTDGCLKTFVHSDYGTLFYNFIVYYQLKMSIFDF